MRHAILLSMMVLLLGSVLAGQVAMDYYYQIGCTHCAEFEKVLEQVQSEGRYNLSVRPYEIRFDSESRRKWEGVSDKFGIPLEERGTPTVVLNDSMIFLGYRDKGEFEKILDRCLAGECEAQGGGGRADVVLNPATAFVAGLISGFNPCLFAVLLFLISYSLGMSENKTRLVKLTVSFSLGIFAAYFVIGWGLLSFAGSFDLESLSIAIAAVVIALGAWTIKDYRNPKSFLVETPEGVKGLSEKFTRKNSVVTSFLLGAVFSLVKAPCVGGVYLAILNMLSTADVGMRLNATTLLASYNLGLVFPLLCISAAVLLGVPPDTIERWRERNKHGMRIFVGATLVLVGLIMLWEVGVF